MVGKIGIQTSFNAKNNVCFKGKPKGAKITQNGLYSKMVRGGYAFSKDGYSDALITNKELIERYPNHYVPKLGRVLKDYHSMYECPYEDGMVGCYYIDYEDGPMEVEDIDDYTKKHGYSGPVYWPIERILEPYEKVQMLIKQNKFEEAFEKYSVADKNSEYPEDNERARQTLIKHLVETGRLDEAFERFPNDSDLIDKFHQNATTEFHALDTILGEAEKITPRIDDFDEKKKKLEKDAQKRLQSAKDNAHGRATGEWLPARLTKDILTLGIYEIINGVEKSKNRKELTKEAHGKNNESEMDFYDKIAETLDLRGDDTNAVEKTVFTYVDYLEKLEGAKAALNSELINLLDIERRGGSAKFPNCVMLYGGNPYEMQDIINWAGKCAPSNFVTVKSEKNMDNMQNNLFNALNTAEDNYQKTGIRSVIFVNGMEKLLNPKLNSTSNISSMKNMMTLSDKNYHSTIIFYTNDKNALDPGTIATHRVGLKIKVPSLNLNNK